MNAEDTDRSRWKASGTATRARRCMGQSRAHTFLRERHPDSTDTFKSNSVFPVLIRLQNLSVSGVIHDEIELPVTVPLLAFKIAETEQRRRARGNLK
jgi:hypothetical protein